MDTLNATDENMAPAVEPPPLAPALDFERRCKSFYRWRSTVKLSWVLFAVGLIASVIITVALLDDISGILVGGNWITEPGRGIIPHLMTLLVVNSIIWPVRQFTLRCFRSEAASLAGAYDIAAIGPLLDAREVKDAKVVALATNGLITILPHVREGEGGLLNWRQRSLLRAALYSDNVALLLAALKALEGIGDGEALWYIAALKGNASHSFTFPSASNPEVRRAAIQCSEAIQARIALGHVRATLLRPSMEDAKGEELLRPAAASDLHVEQLLRPSNVDYEV